MAKGLFQRKYKQKYTKGQMRSMNLSANMGAGEKGVGGSLLLGFSTCASAEARESGDIYVAPMHRLRGIHYNETETALFWHFEPIGGSGLGQTDQVKMTIDAQNVKAKVWRFIANNIGSVRQGDTIVWVYNQCNEGIHQEPSLINDVTAVTITLATV